jgi:hypothetical protein
VKAAFIHVIGDFLQSLGVLIAAIGTLITFNSPCSPVLVGRGNSGAVEMPNFSFKKC